jgi:hypothetical protein
MGSGKGKGSRDFQRSNFRWQKLVLRASLCSAGADECVRPYTGILRTPFDVMPVRFA